MSDNKTIQVDTITALATASGRGGIAVVRISGTRVSEMMIALLHTTLQPRVATLLPFLDENNEVIDEGIALYFPNPHSFTGEDVLELHGHGGPVVVDLLLQRILKLGARLARPGEFSERAFLNGKLDLAQAEAIADLIDASSAQAARLAMRSLQGEFSHHINALSEKIIYLRMYIEAAIDFTDEEIDFLADEKLKAQMEVIIHDLSAIQQNAKQGSFLREGITAVIAGAPNVGKSSLLNSLSGKDTAIVTDIPGTTRDVLRDYILIDGMPMHIVDTAGLRVSEDIVEQEGIRRAQLEIKQADIVLYVQDATRLHEDNAPEFAIDCSQKNIIYIRNKMDLVKSVELKSEINSNVNAKTSNADDVLTNADIISISAKTGAGMSELKSAIKAKVGFNHQQEGVFLARRRHLDALARAQTHVQAALIQLTTAKSGELAAEDLRLAHLALCEITGEFTADDLLGRIFSSFCIGK